MKTEKFETNPLLKGVWLSSGSCVAADMAAEAGFDWAMLDMEHGMNDLSDTLRLIQLLTRGNCLPFVRVPSYQSDAITRLLDCGAAGVMAPQVRTPSEAQAFTDSLRYPPVGTRGLSRSSRAARYGWDFDNYFREANEKVTAIVQVETPEALEHVDMIAAAEGVDVLFIGHSDLSLNLGCHDATDSRVIESAETRVIDACRRHGKRAGMLLKTGMSIDRYIAKGFSFIALGSDVGCLKQGYQQMLRF
jgi:2-keto-3-deoxy-L-rhamnonate aldolase RhmA